VGEHCRYRPRHRGHIGAGAQALSTAEATGTALADADVIVAGAPVLAFRLPSEKMRENLRANPGKAPAPPDISHPSMRSWLEALPAGHGRVRDAPLVVARWCHRGDHARVRVHGIPLAGQGAALYRQKRVRAAARRHVRQTESLTSSALFCRAKSPTQSATVSSRAVWLPLSIDVYYAAVCRLNRGC